MIRFLILVILGALLSFTTKAQEASNFTILDFGPLNLDLDKPSLNPKDALNNIKNKEMRSVLELQNQITMISALANWQEQVTKLSGVYAQAGLPFDPPPPPHEICEQVPPNSICGEAYPEMAPEDKTPPPVQITQAPVTPVKADKDKKKKPEKPLPSYEWDNMQCKAQDCQAVLQDIASGARFTVMQGETVGDGVMVKSITPDGVTLIVKGETQILRPSAGSAKPAANTTAAPQSLQEALKGVPASPDPVEPIVLDDGGATTTTTTTTTTSGKAASESDKANSGESFPSAVPGPTGLF